ncbi:MAG: hypothetical protein HND54_08620 [Bacteroidetes bacterium]|nr:hypothetical protein [Bacteroidota bacterium]NOG57781.1 hypothetical protein [Bacteroidota bacterium]
MNNNKYLIELIDLIEALYKSERVIARKFIQAFTSNLTVNSDKQLLVFDTLVSKPSISYLNLKSKIAPNTTSKSFDALLKRLTEKIRESLIMDLNIFRIDDYSKVFKKKFQIGKALIQARILYSRGLVDNSNRLYDMVIRHSIKFELYDELIDALRFKLTIALGPNQLKEYQRIRGLIKKYEQERDNLNDIRYLIHQYSAESSLKSEKGSMTQKIEKTLVAINQIASKSFSSNTKSVQLLMQIEYLGVKNETSLLFIKGNELLKLLEANVAVHSKNRIIYLSNELAKATLMKYEFAKSLKYSFKSKNLFGQQRNINYITTIMNILKVRILSKNYAKGFSDASELHNSKLIEKYAIEKSILVYNYSILNFGEKNYRTSFQQLNELKIIEKDKEGWNVWIRIMRILCSIELLRLNKVDYDIESFRKYIERISKAGNINARVQLILKVLTELDRCNYNFRLVAQKRRLELENLKNTTGKYKWDIKSPEMILFHDWFEARLHNQSYQPNLEPYKKQMELDDAKPLSKAKAKKYRAMGLID